MSSFVEAMKLRAKKIVNNLQKLVKHCGHRLKLVVMVVMLDMMFLFDVIVCYSFQCFDRLSTSGI